MPRRDRESAQEQQESKEQQQEVGTPQNKAGVINPLDVVSNLYSAAAAFCSSTEETLENQQQDSAVSVATITAAVENIINNPLKKVVFINHVLRFLKQDDYLDSDDDKNKVIPIPKFIELRHVSSSWKETVEFYNPQPQETAVTFCNRFLMSSWEEEKVPSVQCSIVLRDIVGSLCSNVRITYVPGDDDDCASYLLPGISGFFSRCLKSSVWQEEQPGFEHHAALIRDTLLWISKFWIFKRHCYDEDDGELFCDIVSLVIKMKEGEYFGFDTPELRDVLLSISKTITKSDTGCYRYYAVQKWFKLIYDVTRGNEKGQNIFGTKEVLDEFIRLSKVDELELFEDCDFQYGNMEEVAEKSSFYFSMFDALSAITELNANASIFATVELRDMIASLFRYADAWCESRCSGERLSKLLHNLISTNKSNKKLFAVQGIRDVMLRNYDQNEFSFERGPRWDVLSSKDYFNFRHRRFTGNIASNEGACLFFENLVALVEVKPKLFLVDVTRKNFVEFARRTVENNFRFKKGLDVRKRYFGYTKEEEEVCDVSPETIRIYLTALRTMLHHNEKLFFSQRIDKFLIKIKTEKKLLQEESTKLFSEIEEIYEKMKKQLETEKEEKEEEEKRYWGDEEDDDEEEGNKTKKKKKEKKKNKEQKKKKKQKEEEEFTYWYNFPLYDDFDDNYWKDARYSHSYSYWREKLEENRQDSYY